MKTLLALFLFASSAVAQTVTIPSQTVKTHVWVASLNQSYPVTVIIPAQTVPITWPVGLSWTNGVFGVTGAIAATGNVKGYSLSITATPLPFSANDLYLWQLFGGNLQPVPYVPPAAAAAVAK